MQIIDAPIEATAVNPYTQDVADLIEAGEGKAGAIVVPVAEANKSRVKFAKAANDAGKTARLLTPLDELEKDVDGNVTLIFKLTHKHAPRRGKGGTGETTADTSTVESVAEEATATADETPAEPVAEAEPEDKTPVRTRKR